MNKKKKQLILIALLIPVLGFVLYNSLSTVAKKKKPATAKIEAAAVQPGAATTGLAALKSDQGELPPLNEKIAKMQDTIAGEPWGRDPFHPLPVDDRDKPSTNWKDFKLTGVIPDRIATINGEVVGIGEEFEGYLLIKVESNRIILEKTGQSYILTMPED